MKLLNFLIALTHFFFALAMPLRCPFDVCRAANEKIPYFVRLVNNLVMNRVPLKLWNNWDQRWWLCALLHLKSLRNCIGRVASTLCSRNRKILRSEPKNVSRVWFHPLPDDWSGTARHSKNSLHCRWLSCMWKVLELNSQFTSFFAHWLSTPHEVKFNFQSERYGNRVKWPKFAALIQRARLCHQTSRCFSGKRKKPERVLGSLKHPFILAVDSFTSCCDCNCNCCYFSRALIVLALRGGFYLLDERLQ